MLEDYYTNIYLNRVNDSPEQTEHKQKAYEAEIKLRSLLKSDGIELLETLVNEITDVGASEAKTAFVDGCKIGMELAETFGKNIEFNDK